jgi:hypothetical protein
VPVTDNCDGAWYWVAVTIGYNSGWSTAKKLTSTPETTLAGGGASASALTLSLLQPLMARVAVSTIGSNANPITLLFMMIPALAHFDHLNTRNPPNSGSRFSHGRIVVPVSISSSFHALLRAAAEGCKPAWSSIE